MKWLGWAVCVFLGLAAAVVIPTDRERLVRAKARYDKELRQSRAAVEDDLARISQGVVELEKRLAVEKEKTGQMTAAREQADGNRAQKQAAIEELSGRLQTLRDGREDVRDKREENLSEIAELQKRLTQLEEDVTRIEKAMPAVAETAGPEK